MRPSRSAELVRKSRMRSGRKNLYHEDSQDLVKDKDLVIQDSQK